MFRQVRRDVCFPDNASVLYIQHAPDRWDEVLDAGLPVFISSRCGPWEDIIDSLTLAGLAEPSGRVVPLCEVNRGPQEREWTLVLYWEHPQAGWRWRLPLAGRRYVITREASKAAELGTQLEALGARTEALPTISFTAPDDPSVIQTSLQRLPQFDWLIFTSPNGVRSFFEFLDSSEFDHRSLAHAKLACIGPSTATSLRKAGFRCDLMPDRYVAEGLVEALLEELGGELSGLKFLIPRAQEAREIIPDTLRAQGGEVTVAPAYKTVPPTFQMGTPFDPEQRVLFTSSSTVKNWVELTKHVEQPCFCIGPITAQTAREHGFTVLSVAPVHTVEGLIHEVIKVDGKLPQ